MQRPHRVVVAEIGVDAGDRAADRIARALRDAGFEVIHAGRSPGVAPVVSTALQEDADGVGVVAGPAPLAELRAALVERGLDEVVVVGTADTPGADPAAVARQLADALDARDPVAVE